MIASGCALLGISFFALPAVGTCEGPAGVLPVITSCGFLLFFSFSLQYYKVPIPGSVLIVYVCNTLEVFHSIRPFKDHHYHFLQYEL